MVLPSETRAGRCRSCSAPALASAYAACAYCGAPIPELANPTADWSLHPGTPPPLPSRGRARVEARVSNAKRPGESRGDSAGDRAATVARIHELRQRFFDAHEAIRKAVYWRYVAIISVVGVFTFGLGWLMLFQLDRIVRQNAMYLLLHKGEGQQLVDSLDGLFDALQPVEERG